MRNFLIEVKGLRQSTRLGWSVEERSAPQEIGIDLEVAVAVGEGVSQDQTETTVDYRLIVAAIKRLCAEQEWKMLEKMCMDVAWEVKSLAPQVQAVKVQISKNVFSEVERLSVAYHLK
ncbi:MAG: dihydroneopterin aldolase [Oligoflexia bacterium]|nr:dihydroneopterin aldolase [Oligoflexia bacterium]